MKFKQTNNITNSIKISSKTGYWYWKFTFIILAALTVGVYFLVAGEYAKKVKVTGYLAPITGISSVLSNAAGVVVALYVTNQQKVQEGDILLRIVNKQQVSSSLYIYNNLVGLQQELPKLVNSLAVTRQLAIKIKDNYERLEQSFGLGLVSFSRLISAEKQLLDINNQIREHTTNINKIKQEISSYQYKIKQLQEGKISLAVVGADGADKEQRLANDFVITASRTGFVSILQVSKGSSVAAGQFLMNIIPSLKPKLEAIFYIPSYAVGFVAVGQRVNLHYDTFPYQKFGSFSAHLTSITTSPTRARYLPFVAASNKKGLFFEARAVLVEQQVPVFRQDIALKTGLTFSADLILAKRSLVEWLFEPYFGAYRRVNR